MIQEDLTSSQNEPEGVLDVKPTNLQELLSRGIMRNTEGADFRDTSIIVLRHADEREDSEGRTIGISDEGNAQISSAVGGVAAALRKVGTDIIIKFYSSPNKWAEVTAGHMIEEIEGGIENGSWPRNVRLLSIPGSRQKPRKRQKVTRDILVDRSDVKSILAERESRRKAGEGVEFSTVLIEKDRRGELQPGTEGRELVVRRLTEVVGRLQKINERILDKGEKLLLILITHNIYFEAFLGEKAEGCQGVRIDLPLKAEEKLVLVGANNSRELDWQV
ncbi:MAG TPA: hypothetical protein VMW41_03415 [Candidatus Bathyarchaeia archaeon]|nr:hypothetical protein [Candidatus Bathyarchaeia archaeon]